MDKNKIEGEEIDWTLLADSIPTIDTPPIKAVKKQEQEEIKEFAIGEANSIEDFNKIDTKSANESTEEEEEISEETEDSTTSTEDISNDEEISPIKGLALWAKEKGLLEYEDDKFEDSEEWLETTIGAGNQKKIDIGIQQYKDEVPGIVKDILNNYEEGVPLDELIYSKSRQIEYNNIKETQLEENKDLQKKLVSDWLANQEYTEEEITDTVKKYEDSLLLDDQAKIALKKLKVFEQKYQDGLVKAAADNKKVQDDKYKETIKNIEKEILASEEIIPGIKTTLEDRKKVFEAYTKQDSKRETALIKKLRSDPKAWFKITQFMVLMDGNLDSVQKAATTKATQKVKETVSSTPDKKGTLDKINLSKIKKAIALSKKQK